MFISIVIDSKSFIRDRINIFRRLSLLKNASLRGVDSSVLNLNCYGRTHAAMLKHHELSVQFTILNVQRTHIFTTPSYHQIGLYTIYRLCSLLEKNHKINKVRAQLITINIFTCPYAVYTRSACKLIYPSQYRFSSEMGGTRFKIIDVVNTVSRTLFRSYATTDRYRVNGNKYIDRDALSHTSPERAHSVTRLSSTKSSHGNHKRH